MTHPSTSSQDLTRLTETQLVDEAIENTSFWKDAYFELERRAPADAAADAVVRRFESGTVAPWLAAALLQACASTRAGATALKILQAAPGSLAESYAAGALARASGLGAEADFLRLLAAGATGRVRAAAAHGLVAIRSPAARPEILAAVRAGRVRPSTAGHQLACLEWSPDELCDLLRSDDGRERAVALEIVLVQSSAASTIERDLADEVRGALERAGTPLARRSRATLERRLQR